MNVGREGEGEEGGEGRLTPLTLHSTFSGKEKGHLTSERCRADREMAGYSQEIYSYFTSCVICTLFVSFLLACVARRLWNWSNKVLLL